MRFKKILSISLLLFLFFCPSSFCQDSSSQCFALYGDSHRDDAIHMQIVDAIMKIHPVAVFHVGDFVNKPRDRDEWEASKKIIADLLKVTKFYLTVGNHDESPWVTVFFDFPGGRRWYSVEYNNIHFTILDSNISLKEGSQQYDWLESDLRNIGNNIKFRIVIMHHPIFTTGYHGFDSKGLRDSLVPLFERYNVDMVFGGHDHNYERSQYHDIYYIVTGGGTSMLYGQRIKNSPYSQFFLRVNHFCTLCVTDDKLTMTAIDLDKNVIDEVEVTKNENALRSY